MKIPNINILCIGGITTDIIVDTDKVSVQTDKKSGDKMIAFPYGEKVVADSVTHTYGGGALNTAITLRALGLKAQVMAAVGVEQRHALLSDYLKKRGLSDRFVQYVKDEETALSLVVNSPREDEHVLFVHQGAAEKFRFNQSELDKYSSDWIMLTSLRGQVADANLQRVFKYQTKNNVRLFWNPGEQQILHFRKYRNYLRQVEVLSLNLAEVERVAQTLGIKRPTVPAIVKKLMSLGVQKILITEGKKGVTYFDNQRIIFQPAERVAVRNTTGAGDALNAGFMAGLLIFNEPERALRLGVKNAARVIRTVGAHEGVLRRSDL
ncbi:MAG: PfkB family carbohydrate kinase [Candidatus Komeilibacteria bacterium]|nr:PfkB family carbohydrate kinase [Candidatus Komeilibacteria bacterium]